MLSFTLKLQNLFNGVASLFYARWLSVLDAAALVPFLTCLLPWKKWHPPFNCWRKLFFIGSLLCLAAGLLRLRVWSLLLCDNSLSIALKISFCFQRLHSLMSLSSGLHFTTPSDVFQKLGICTRRDAIDLIEETHGITSSTLLYIRLKGG